MRWGIASDMVRMDSGKDAGVRDILRHMALGSEEAMCFGDAETILPCSGHAALPSVWAMGVMRQRKLQMKCVRISMKTVFTIH